MQDSAPVDHSPVAAMAASMVACALVLLLERLLAGPPPPWAVWAYLAGLGAGFGLLVSVLTNLWLRLGRRLGADAGGWRAWAHSALPGLGFATWLVTELQALPKLHGKHAALAAGALLGALVLWGTITAVVYIRRLGAAVGERGMAAAVALSAAVLLVGERHALEATYPGFHTGVQLLGLWLCAMASCLAWPALVVVPRQAVAIALLFVAVPFLRLDDGRELASVAQGRLAWTTIVALRWIADVDGDGHASVLGGGDCAALDAHVNPSAPEVAGNGVDDNCRLGDAVVQSPSRHVSDPPSGDVATHVVLITLDALRPDRMSSYGYERPTTPNIARFFEAGVRFDNAFTAGGGTSISIAALLRGRYPRHLQLSAVAQSNLLELYPRAVPIPTLKRGEYLVGDYLVARDDPHPTIARLLTEAGRTSIAAVDDGLSELLAPGMGTDDGFDVYLTAQSDDYWSCQDAQTTDLALAALAKLPAGKPMFLWLHLYGPHLPSIWHEGTVRHGDSEPDRYDHELTFADAQVGRLLDAVVQRGEAAQTLFILSADHGENFWGQWERNHGTNLHAAAIRVPLLIRGPGFTSGVVASVVSTVDIVPTILEATGSPLPVGLDGVALRGWNGQRDRPIVVETVGISPRGTPLFDYVGVIGPRHMFWIELVEQRTWFGRHDDMGQPPRQLFGHPQREVLERSLFGRLEYGPGLLGFPTARSAER